MAEDLVTAGALNTSIVQNPTVVPDVGAVAQKPEDASEGMPPETYIPLAAVGFVMFVVASAFLTVKVRGSDDESHEDGTDGADGRRSGKSRRNSSRGLKRVPINEKADMSESTGIFENLDSSSTIVEMIAFPSDLFSKESETNRKAVSKVASQMSVVLDQNKMSVMLQGPAVGTIAEDEARGIAVEVEEDASEHETAFIITENNQVIQLQNQ